MTRTLLARRPAPAGAMRHRLAIEQPVDVDDGAGGVTRGYATLATVWAAIEPIEADAQLVDNRPGARLSHRVVMRWRGDVDTEKRLRFGARILRILAVSDPDERRRRLAILAEEDAP